MTTAKLSEGDYLRLGQVLELVPVSRSTWYRGVKSGIYPRPVRLSERTVAWKAVEIGCALRALENVELESVS